MEKSKLLKWQQYDYYGILTISNPPKNLIIEPDFVELDKLKAWTSNESLKGIIITGEGHHFSTGADIDKLDELKKTPDILEKKLKKSIKILSYIQNLNIPVISAIQGVCLGGGLEIALNSHIRICSKKSIFAFPESDLNLMPGLGGIYNFVNVSGIEKAIQYVLSSEFFTASEALEIGLVSYVVESNNLLDFAISLLNKMVKNRKKKVINYVMNAIHNSRQLNREEAIKRETQMFVELAKDEINSK